MSVVDSCNPDPAGWLPWIECHPGLASWIQAVGTLVALAIAVGVPLFIEFVSGNEKRQRTRAETTFIYLKIRSDLLRLYGAATLRQKWFRERPPHKVDGQTIRTWLDEHKMPVTSALTDACDPRFNMALDFSIPLLECIAEAQDYNEWVDAAVNYPDDFYPEHWHTMKSLMPQMAEAAANAAMKAVNAGGKYRASLPRMPDS